MDPLDPALLIRGLLGAAAAGSLFAFAGPAADALFGKAARAIRRRRRRARARARAAAAIAGRLERQQAGRC